MIQKKDGLTIIEILVVVLIIGVLVFLLLPVVDTGPQDGAKRASTKSLIGTLGMALESYANDFDGYYPPDTIDSKPLMMDGTIIKNSAQALCYFNESEFISADDRKSGAYIVFKGINKLFRGDAAYTSNIKRVCNERTVSLGLSKDFVVDSFHSPLFYDERKSEEDMDGLNKESFVIISGGTKDKNASISLKDLDPGDLSMFDEDQLKNFDTVRSGYQDKIPPTSSSTNDDIINM